MAVYVEYSDDSYICFLLRVGFILRGEVLGHSRRSLRWARNSLCKALNIQHLTRPSPVCGGVPCSLLGGVYHLGDRAVPGGGVVE